jgi:putative membrane protein
MQKHLLIACLAAALIGCETEQKQQSANAPPDQQNNFRAQPASARMEAQVETPTNDASNPNMMDSRTFIQEAASSSWFEVKSAELAKQRATSDRTKVFADHLMQDHQKANDDLAKIAEKQKFELAKDLQPNEKATLDKLTSVPGTNFDAEFVQAQLKAHQQAIQLFEKASKNLQDKQLKEFAEQYLPMLREHLKMAQDESKFFSTPDQSQQAQ